VLYYVYVEGQAVGPLSLEQVKPLVESGKVTGDTLAWTEALERWQSARTLPPLAEAFPSLAAASPRRLHAEKAQDRTVPLADFGVRFLAGALDFLILGLPTAALMIASSGAAPGQAQSALLPGLALADWVFFLASSVYFIGFMSKAGGGRTPGYRLLGLRLVARATKEPARLGAVVLWAIVNSINFVGFLWYFFNAERRMLHNIVSDTLVLKVK
jgi:uncharacterized RDD family membrane protein YckC